MPVNNIHRLRRQVRQLPHWHPRRAALREELQKALEEEADGSTESQSNTASVLCDDPNITAADEERNETLRAQAATERSMRAASPFARRRRQPNDEPPEAA